MATSTNTPDFTGMFKDMMSNFPGDTGSIQDMFRTSASYGEKLSKVAIEAADKSTEISTKWTRDTLAKMTDVTRVKDEPADYSKSFSDFASAQAEMAAQTMAAFAEVAKKVQMETVELMLSAGKTAADDGQAAMKKAGNEMTAATKKATATAA